MVADVFERHVMGMDPFRIETLWRRVYGSGYTLRPDISLMGVLSAIETALWDIIGKAVDKPSTSCSAAVCMSGCAHTLSLPGRRRGHLP
jgi:L-alanine-DL-glutamate epimerase-like enolase superfamily enzyme